VRFPIIAPGRVGDPYLEDGDAVCLADRHGCPVGEWVPVMPGCDAVRLLVPDDAGPVKCYLARDRHGRIQWWSSTTWYPTAMPGQWVHLPLRRDQPRILHAGSGGPNGVRTPDPTPRPRPEVPRVKVWERKPRPVSPADLPPRHVVEAAERVVRWSSP